MKTLVLHGSPRRNGSSDTLVAHFLKGLRESGSSAITEFFTNDLNIKPCQMCESCNKPPDYACVIKDGMYEIYSAFAEADIIVFATPMLWGYMTAQLKIVLDRMEALASQRHLKGKTFVVIVTYRRHYESTAAFFKRAFADYFGVNLHTIIYCSVDKGSGREMHVSNCKEKLAEAFELGKNLGKTIKPQHHGKEATVEGSPKKE